MSKQDLENFITPEQFARLEAAYTGRWGAKLVLSNMEGVSVYGNVPPCHAEMNMRQLLRQQIDEAVRWGEPPFTLLSNGDMIWVVPVILNTEILGGVAAFAVHDQLNEDRELNFLKQVRMAADDLNRLLERENLTNPALLELRRNQNLLERRKAEAIHDYKILSPDFRFLYIDEEPHLMNAIRRGEREEARGILNKILLALMYQSGGNLNLLKSFILELVTMMCRAAVEAGCDAYEVFGDKYEDFTTLSKIDSDDEFSPWLHQIMERLIDVIHNSPCKSVVPRMKAVMDYIREHIADDISRKQVAGVAHMSPSHFSRFFKRNFNESFSDRLNRMRIEHATELLTRTNLGLSVIAQDCGFKDQSYFTKVFRRYYDITPARYRIQMSPKRLMFGG